jgi:ADP-heptose:LPS heptosyltransferase
MTEAALAFARTAPQASFTPGQVRFLAFNRNSALVFKHLALLPGSARPAFYDRYVLNQAVKGAIDRMRQLSAGEEETRRLFALVSELLSEFESHCVATGNRPEEYFQAWEWWTTYLVESADYAHALQAADTALAAGAARFPRIRLSLWMLQTESLLEIGETDRATAILTYLAQHPYLVPDRHAVTRIADTLGRMMLAAGAAGYHKRLAWCALRQFHSNDTLRQATVGQLSRTYGGTLRPLRAPEAGAWERLAYAACLLHFGLSRSRLYRGLRLGRASRLAMLGTSYAANYLRAESQYDRWIADSERASSGVKRDQRKGILVTRAMGGLGDLLTMTPGLHALKRKFPAQSIYFAIPKSFHSLFAGNPDFTLLDVESPDIDIAGFSGWYNLTDCPAARVESRSAPQIAKNRIEIFAYAMGISRAQLDCYGRTPHYFVQAHEQTEAATLLAGFRRHRQLVGVQFYAAETYRNYPHMGEVVDRLALDYDVIVFHGEPITGMEHPSVFKCDRFPLRTSIALLAQCDAFVGPDSSLFHFAAALALPSLIVSGPIDGKVRSADYPKCEFIDARDVLGCIPCWRNEIIDCRTSGTRVSACLSHVAVDRVLARTRDLLRNAEASEDP